MTGLRDRIYDQDGFADQVRAALARRRRETLDNPELTCAAVLIPLLYMDGEWHIVVTLRTEQVRYHRGQISFPGGACEPGDPDLMATALRETEEELGIPPEAIDVLGSLDDLHTITDFAVTPFVGALRRRVPYRLNEVEVAAAIEVPLSFLLDPGRLRVEQLERDSKLFEVLFWDYGSHTIWGATARILKGLVDLMAEG